MTWFRVDDGFPEHPKLEALEADPRRYMAAITVWTIMGADCSRRLTDGFVSRARLEKVMFRLGKAALDGAAALVACELWEVVEGGWQYHDWHDYQPAKGDVDAARRAKSDRQRRWRSHRVDASTGDGVDDSVDGLVDASTRRHRGGGVDAAPVRASPVPSRPVPSRPIPPVAPQGANAAWEPDPEPGTPPEPEPPNPSRFKFELEELVRGEFFERNVTPQKAPASQWRDGCQTVADALQLGAYPNARTAMRAFARCLVDACAGGKPLGLALQQTPLGAQLKPVARRQLSELAQRRLAEGT